MARIPAVAAGARDSRHRLTVADEATKVHKNVDVNVYNIYFEVVPGVSAGIAAPAYAGIPLTHRDHCSSFEIITGHEDPTKGESAASTEFIEPRTSVETTNRRDQKEIMQGSLMLAGRVTEGQQFVGEAQQSQADKRHALAPQSDRAVDDAMLWSLKSQGFGVAPTKRCFPEFASQNTSLGYERCGQRKSHFTTWHTVNEFLGSSRRTKT